PPPRMHDGDRSQTFMAKQAAKEQRAAMATKNSSETTPYWTTSASFPQFARLAEDVVADVVVVGGGVTGLSAAYLLAKAGKRVIVLERDRCAAIDTGHTSAHVTMVTDTRLSELVKRFGRNHAQAVWDAG